MSSAHSTNNLDWRRLESSYVALVLFTYSWALNLVGLVYSCTCSCAALSRCVVRLPYVQWNTIAYESVWLMIINFPAIRELIFFTLCVWRSSSSSLEFNWAGCWTTNGNAFSGSTKSSTEQARKRKRILNAQHNRILEIEAPQFPHHPPRRHALRGEVAQEEEEDNDDVNVLLAQETIWYALLKPLLTRNERSEIDWLGIYWSRVDKMLRSAFSSVLVVLIGLVIGLLIFP